MIHLAELIVATVIVLATGCALLLWFAGVVAPLFAPLDRYPVRRMERRAERNSLLKE